LSRAGYDALIFDLDGTLWNVNESCTDAWNIVLEELGHRRRITLEEMNSATGKPMDEIIRTLLPGIDHNHDELYNRFNKKEEELIGRQGTFLYPGMKDGIGMLSEYCRIFIVSNCQGWYLNRFLDYSGLKSKFSGWDCYGDSGIEKHEMISVLKDKNNIGNALYIGDTIIDRDSARRSLTDFVQVTYGFGLPIDGEIHFGSFIALSEYLKSRI
jgi:phosphoglycolate phosphatase